MAAAFSNIGAASNQCPCAIYVLQAENGIRYLYVTGVQTCALPISGPPPHPRHGRERAAAERQPRDAQVLDQVAIEEDGDSHVPVAAEVQATTGGRVSANPRVAALGLGWRVGAQAEEAIEGAPLPA